MSRARAFLVVDEFEAALCEYTGAPYAVAVDSCTNAILLSAIFCKWTRYDEKVTLPKHTYVGVLAALENAGFDFELVDEKWSGSYRIEPLPIVDSAKRFERGMYEPGTLTCVSFQAGKHLPIGRGGAILHDREQADGFLRRARLDGRAPGQDYTDNTYQLYGYHCYMTPPDAARGLWLMTYLEDGPDDTWEAYPDLSEATWV